MCARVKYSQDHELDHKPTLKCYLSHSFIPSNILGVYFESTSIPPSADKEAAMARERLEKDLLSTRARLKESGSGSDHTTEDTHDLEPANQESDVSGKARMLWRANLSRSWYRSPPIPSGVETSCLGSNYDAHFVPCKEVVFYMLYIASIMELESLPFLGGFRCTISFVESLSF